MRYNHLHAFPLSDLFIAKRVQQIPMKWLLFDAYKVDYDFDMEVYENGIIDTTANGSLEVKGISYLAKRRKNLRGISIPCGLVVMFTFNNYFIQSFLQVMKRNPSIISIENQ